MCVLMFYQNSKKNFLNLLFSFFLKRKIFIFLIFTVFIFSIISLNLLLNLSTIFKNELTINVIWIPFGILNFGPLIISFLISNLTFEYFYNFPYLKLFLINKKRKYFFHLILNWYFAIFGYLFFLLEIIVSLIWNHNQYVQFNHLINWKLIFFSSLFLVILANQFSYTLNLIKFKKVKNFLIYFVFIFSLIFSGILVPYQLYLFTQNNLNKKLINLLRISMIFPFTYATILLNQGFLNTNYYYLFNIIPNWNLINWIMSSILIIPILTLNLYKSSFVKRKYFKI